MEYRANFAEGCETGLVQDPGTEVVVEVITKVLEVSTGRRGVSGMNRAEGKTEVL